MEANIDWSNIKGEYDHPQPDKVKEDNEVRYEGVPESNYIDRNILIKELTRCINEHPSNEYENGQISGIMQAIERVKHIVTPMNYEWLPNEWSPIVHVHKYTIGDQVVVRNPHVYGVIVGMKPKTEDYLICTGHLNKTNVSNWYHIDEFTVVKPIDPYTAP